jgi:hypothetical protein
MGGKGAVKSGPDSGEERVDAGAQKQRHYHQTAWNLFYGLQDFHITSFPFSL